MSPTEQFLSYMESERRASPRTIATYRQDIDRFLRYIEQSEAEFDPVQVTTNDLRSWVMIQMERKVAVGSINRNLSTLRSLFRYLMRQEIVTSNPALRIRPLKTGIRLPHFVEQSRMKELTDILSEPSEDYTTERNAVIILLLYACGLRRSEITILTTDSLNIAEKTLRVTGKGAKQRMIPIPDPMAKRLEHYLMVRNSEKICYSGEKSLFLSNKFKPIQVHTIYNLVREHLRMAGVQGKQSPHVLRHTFATHLMQQGASIRSVQQLLGHESLAATQIYTHNTIEKLKESYDKAHPRANLLTKKSEE